MILNFFFRNRYKLLIIFSNLFFYLFLFNWISQNINPQKLFHSFNEISFMPFLASITINLIALLFYGLRMNYLISNKYINSFSIINIGYSLNTLLPFRLGEFFKILISYKIYKISFKRILAATVTEKAIDLFKLIIIGIILLLTAHNNILETFVFNKLSILSIFFIFLITCGIIFFTIKKQAYAFLRKGLKYLCSMPLLKIFTTSLVIWIINIMLVYFAFNYYISDINISIYDAVAILIIFSLSVSLPSAPAGIGVFEASIVYYLTNELNMSNEIALSLSFAFHLATTLPQLFLTLFLLRKHLNYNFIKNIFLSKSFLNGK